MANQKQGFEGEAYYGVAGSTGGTKLVNSRDISFNMDPERADTTVRGDGAAPPIKTEAVSQRVVSIEIVMLNDSTDTALEAMRVAAYSGSPVAIRLKDYAAGKGFDGDCTLGVSHPYPLNGEQVVTLSCTPTRAADRTPSLYV